MVRVRIDGIEREYPADATWQQVAGDYQDSFENDILLVKINGKLQELHKRVREGSLSFVTAEEKPGMSAYQRSATLMMLKASSCSMNWYSHPVLDITSRSNWDDERS